MKRIAKYVVIMLVMAAVLCSLTACRPIEDDEDWIVEAPAATTSPIKIKPNLKETHDTIMRRKGQSTYYGVEIGSDGSYLSIDTNPFDLDDHIDMEIYDFLKEFTSELGLPESLIAEMNKTRSVDGRMSDTFEDIEVTWSYHPDKGLQVLFKII